jgi:hypothetical protein
MDGAPQSDVGTQISSPKRQSTVSRPPLGINPNMPLGRQIAMRRLAARGNQGPPPLPRGLRTRTPRRPLDPSHPPAQAIRLNRLSNSRRSPLTKGPLARSRGKTAGIRTVADLVLKEAG